LSGSFLDTTIVVNISDPSSKSKETSEKFISQNQPSATPYYALRELLAGHIQNLCDVHNSILASENISEAFISLTRKNFYSGRKQGSKLSIGYEALDKLFRDDPKSPRGQMKTEALEWLAIRANNMWRKAIKPNNVEVVQSLSCFNSGKLTFGLANELRGPNNSFNCHSKLRCSAASYIYDDLSSLSKMIEALHPDKIDVSLANKQETKSRRKALKELRQHGPDSFNKNGCRALGDAYFAAMCPAGKSVVTTNIVDFEPLCSALGKDLKGI
jgi:hypothetical protein